MTIRLWLGIMVLVALVAAIVRDPSGTWWTSAVAPFIGVFFAIELERYEKRRDA